MKDSKKHLRGLSFDLISKYRGFLMGVSILQIILFHHLMDCRDKGVHYGTVSALLMRCFSSSGVDVFMLLSGFGLYYSFRKNSSIPAFFKRRYTRILIPYTLVAVPSMVMWNILNTGGVRIVKILKDFFFVTLFTTGYRWYWFIFAIGLCYLLFPCLYQLFAEADSKSEEVMRVAQIYALVSVAALILKDGNTDLFDRINLMLLRMPHFALGCLLGKMSYEKRKISPYMLFLMAVALLSLPFAKGSGMIIGRYFIAFSTFSVCLISIVLLELMDRQGSKPLHLLHGGIVKVTDVFGRYSLELYLTHVMLRPFLIRAGRPTYARRNELLLVALSIGVSLLLKPLSQMLEKPVLAAFGKKKA